jgi:4-deoxy-L-threo-5-hexosulose-uronate ketol-isomerase
MMNTAALRDNYLIQNLLLPTKITWTYSHYDRMMIGGVVPTGSKIALLPTSILKANYFLERRELGIINIGAKGFVEVDGNTYVLEKQDCLYIGKGSQTVHFRSDSAQDPAYFYLLSTPAHASYPISFMTSKEANPMTVGSTETANLRTIYKYIHAQGIQSSQLVMGLTTLHVGSVWNTMPPHVHDRRMEVYFYFNLPSEQRILHLMGEPNETRHLWVANHQAIISPPWSIHAGCGTSNYSFIWGMAGENKDYSDMDAVPLPSML